MDGERGMGLDQMSGDIRMSPSNVTSSTPGENGQQHADAQAIRRGAVQV
jgi:hypothetical protein